jgi:hypothetical protein
MGITISKREIYPWNSNQLKRDVFMEQQSVKTTTFLHKRMKAKTPFLEHTRMKAKKHPFWKADKRQAERLMEILLLL